MHKRAAFLIPKKSDGAARHIKGPHQMNVDHRLERLERQLVKVPITQNAGIVDNAIDTPELFNRMRIIPSASSRSVSPVLTIALPPS